MLSPLYMRSRCITSPLSRLAHLRLRSAVCLMSGALMGASASSAAADTRSDQPEQRVSKDVASSKQDEFSWLEQNHDQRVLSWVQRENERTASALKADSRYETYKRGAAEATRLQDQDPVLNVKTTMVLDGWIYHTLQNDDHPRGLWRRTTVDSYVRREPQWQSLLDIDALSAREGRLYSFGIAKCQLGGNRCMLSLNEGGAPRIGAGGYREFDLQKREFVKGGFQVPPSTSGTLQAVLWHDPDTLWVARDFGPGSLSQSLAPLVIKSWKRGGPLSAAREVFRVGHDDLSTGTFLTADNWFDNRKRQRTIAVVSHGHFRHEVWLYARGNAFIKLALPDGIIPLTVGQLYEDELVFATLQEWKHEGKIWPANALLSVSLSDAERGVIAPRLLRAPESGSTPPLAVNIARNGVYLPVNANGRAELWLFLKDGPTWKSQRVDFPPNGVIGPALSDPLDNVLLAKFQSVVQPPTEYAVHSDGKLTEIKRHRAAFDTAQYTFEQLEAKSADGTLVPYFLARPQNLAYDGRAPTLLYGYGAFGMPNWPIYDGVKGRLWLAQGGVYAIANTRGDAVGQQHAVRAQRRQVYDDFAAIAEDMIRRKITSPERLGIFGMSAGGLLAGVMVTQRPHLFNAAIIMVPVLDLFRPDLLGSGAHEDEFGYFDVPADRAFLEQTSPFQNLRKGVSLPTPLIITSTTDSNVFPAQARRFAAKAASLGLPYLYWETAEGGHGAATTPEQGAENDALMFVYLTQRLMDAPPRTTRTP
jgi:prolyl oligopeptidase